METRKIRVSNYTDQRGYEKTQYSVTVPKRLAEEYDMAGAELEWVESDDDLTLEVRVIRNE